MQKNELTFDINKQISDSWDKNVSIRVEDIESGTDYTYTNVIIPWVLKQVSDFSTFSNSILDIGCGCGFLTNCIFENGYKKIRGIDISLKSIEYAKKKFQKIPFQKVNICTSTFNEEFDIALAIMSLNNMSSIDEFFLSVNKILRPFGKLIVVLPHPCFWPIKHLKNEFYSYIAEKCYKTNFKTKGRQDYPAPVYYFHRSIEKYYECIRKAGFEIIEVEELCESGKDTTPDIIGIVIQKVNKS